MIKPFHFTIQLPPITKKNSQEIITKTETSYEFIGGKVIPKTKSKPVPLPSKQFRSYQEEAGWFIPYRGKKISEPLEIKCLFYMPTKRKTDLTNLLEAIDDILVYYDVIEDDNYNIIVSHDGSRAFYDKENPRTEIFISPYTETIHNTIESGCKLCSISDSPCPSCPEKEACAIQQLCKKKEIWVRIKEKTGFCPECGRKL